MMFEDQVVEVRRSARRRRTVSAYQADGRIVIQMPARMSRQDEEQHIANMIRRLRRPARQHATDAVLQERSEQLSRRYLADAPRPTSVQWVGNQVRRWGSCTPSTGRIRLSDRLRGMPGYVVDYVLLHELAHLIEPNHGREFWTLLAPYPDLMRAQAYLDGVSFGSGLSVDAPDIDEPAAEERDAS